MVRASLQRQAPGSKPFPDGTSAARIEEEIVVTDEGPAILTHFPAQELMVANRY